VHYDPRSPANCSGGSRLSLLDFDATPFGFASLGVAVKTDPCQQKDDGYDGGSHKHPPIAVLGVGDSEVSVLSGGAPGCHHEPPESELDPPESDELEPLS
jgi:hypothetical protein